jgi:hypothetical protein
MDLIVEMQAGTRRASAFLRSGRQQGNKYGIKESCGSAARQALAVLGTAARAHDRAHRTKC